MARDLWCRFCRNLWIRQDERNFYEIEATREGAVCEESLGCVETCDPSGIGLGLAGIGSRGAASLNPWLMAAIPPGC